MIRADDQSAANQCTGNHSYYRSMCRHYECGNKSVVTKTTTIWTRTTRSQAFGMQAIRSQAIRNVGGMATTNHSTNNLGT